jgi:hypothetical protein
MAPDSVWVALDQAHGYLGQPFEQRVGVIGRLPPVGSDTPQQCLHAVPPQHLRSTRETVVVTESSGPLGSTGSKGRTEPHFERPPPGPIGGTVAAG